MIQNHCYCPIHHTQNIGSPPEIGQFKRIQSALSECLINEFKARFKRGLDIIFQTSLFHDVSYFKTELFVS